MVGYFIGAEETGKYAVSSKIAMLIGLIIVVANLILAPRLAQLSSEDSFGEFRKLAEKSTFYLGLIGIMAFCFFFIFGEYILSIFGSEFSQDLTLLIVLSFGQLVNVFVGPVGYVIIALNRESVLGIYSTIALGINATLNVVLITHFGVMGAAVATALSVILFNVFCLFYIRGKKGFFTISVWLKPARSWRYFKIGLINLKQLIV